MSLIYRWDAPFQDGWKARLNGLELVCGNEFLHHVDFRNWRTPPRVRALGAGRDCSWLDTSRRIVTMVRPIDNHHAVRFEWHLDSEIPQNPTPDDTTLVASNEFTADGAGTWASYYDAARRIVANGHVVVPTGARGVAASAGELVTKLNDTVFAVYQSSTGEILRSFTPQGTFNAFTFDDGWIGHGASGDAHVITREGVHRQVNVYLGSVEGVPRVKTGPDGRKWVFTSIDFADGTHAILGRPFGETECLVVPGIGFADFSVGYDDELRRFVLAGNGDRGELTLLVVNAMAQRVRVEPRIKTFPRPFVVAGFYGTTDLYPQTIRDFPQHWEIVVEPGPAGRTALPTIVGHGAIPGVREPSRVRGIYVAEEVTSTGASIDVEAELARASWRQAFPGIKVPPVVGYLTDGMVGRTGWPPKKLDVYAPQMYLNSSYTRLAIQRLYDAWAQVLPADRQWLLTVQAYDRNIPQPEQMRQLASIVDAYLDVSRDAVHVVGIAPFAINRIGTKDGKPIGGVVVYPELLPAYQRVFSAIPESPRMLKYAQGTNPNPDPGGDMLKVHVGDYAKTGKLGEPASIDFRIESDHPVTLIRIDLRRDGKPGLCLTPTSELPDLRRLRGVKIEMETAGNLSWHVRAENGVDAPDESQSERTIEVAR